MTPPRKWRMPALSTLAAAALLLLHAGLAWRVRYAALGTGDQATYVLLGRSLRSFAYQSIHLVGTPRHVQYPPGFPALLAVEGALFGERLELFIAVQVLLSGAALALLFVTVRRRWTPLLALLLLAACAVNPLLVESAGELLSETPFLTLTMVALWATARDDPSARWLVVAGAGALAAALTRTVGVTLVAALLVAWSMERRWRAASALLAAAAVLLGGWLLWTLLEPRDALHYSYGTDIARGYGAVASPTSAGISAVRGIAHRVIEYVTRLVPWVIPLPTVPHTRLDNIAWVCFLLGVGAAGTLVLWRRWRVAALFLAAYAVALALWPWALERLLVPVVPLILLALLAGTYAVAARIGGVRVARVAPIVLAGGVVAVAAGRLVAVLPHRACPAPGARGCATPSALNFAEAAEYIRAHSDPRDRVITTPGAAFYYMTGRVTLPIVVLAAPGSESRPNGGIEPGAYVLLRQTSEVARRAATRLRAHCERLTLVRRFPPTTLLLRATDGGPRSGREACAALDDFTSTSRIERGPRG